MMSGWANHIQLIKSTRQFKFRVLQTFCQHFVARCQHWEKENLWLGEKSLEKGIWKRE